MVVPTYWERQAINGIQQAIQQALQQALQRAIQQLSRVIQGAAGYDKLLSMYMLHSGRRAKQNVEGGCQRLDGYQSITCSRTED
jgi:hypothetical protein